MASIKKLDTRKFKITVSNGYRLDGKRVSRAKTITVPTTVGGRGIPQYVAHKAEEFEKLIKSGYCEDGEMTFQEYATRWLERQTKYAPSILGFYRRSLETVYPQIGSVKLNRLRPVALENLLVELRKRTYHGKPIQEATVQKYLTVVSAVLSDAKRNEIIEKNPARMIDLPETARRTQLIPTDEEAHRFLNLLAEEVDPYKTFYALAIYTGCRRGELCALKWEDIVMNGDECVLTVSRSRSSVPGKGVVEGTTKNGHARTIYVSEDMTSILRCYCYQKMCEAKAGGFKMSDYVFTNERGELMHPDIFSRHLRCLYDENGFPQEFHLHTLRHYFVSTMLHNGKRRAAQQKTIKPPEGLTPKQREKWLNEQAVLFEKECKDTPLTVNKTITLAEYVKIWLRDIASDKLAKSTLARDKQDIDRFLPHLGAYKLTDLRPEHFRRLYAELRKQTSQNTGKPLSECTVEGVHACLCGILSDAMESGFLDHNPAWKTYKYSGKKKEKLVADEETVQKIITALENESIKYETYYKLIIATGMRRGECCGLKWRVC